MLSICIPAYKYVRYSMEAVRSILAQDVDVELIVAEDFVLVARDDPEYPYIEAARELFHGDSRVRCLSNAAPLPIQQNWNHTVAQATRPYVKLMGADDRIAPGGLARLEQRLRQVPEAIFHGHLARIIDSDGQHLRDQQPYTLHGEGFRTAGKQALKLKLRQVARFKEPVCNAFSREVWERLGGYGDNYRFCFDVAYNSRVMASGSCCLWNDYIAEMRRHGGSDGAKLPADLAVADLRRLINEIYGVIGEQLTRSDQGYGEGWYLYRVFELAVARYRSEPWQLLKFFFGHLAEAQHKSAAMARAAAIVYRRLARRDVQLTLDHAPGVAS